MSLNILAIAQVEDAKNIDKQIAKQTYQPTSKFIHLDEKPARGINSRRRRIAENHQILQDKVKEVKPDLVWQIEGDCDLPEDTLSKLVADYMELRGKDFGYVSGIQVGRHGLYCLGAWQFQEDFKMFKSLDYKAKGIQEVDASGFYCLLAPADVWLKGLCEWDWDTWGPDVNFGISLKAQGYKIYCDMGIKIGHITARGTIHPDNPSTENVIFTESDGKWSYKTK